MIEQLKLDTDIVVLRNKTKKSEKRTTRLYAKRKVENNPETYEIVELWQHPKEQPISQPI